MTNPFKKSRPLALMLSLFGLLLIYPHFHREEIASLVLNGLFAITVFGAIWAGKGHKYWRIAALLLGVVWLGGRIGREYTTAGFELNLLSLACLVSFCFLTLWMQFELILKAESINWQVLCRAVSGYLLLGLAWAGIYEFVTALDPNALSIPEYTSASGKTWSDLIYFSYVTLTTLGYGDITPVSSQARSLAIIEAVVGQLYLAVVIARLVASYRIGSRKKAPTAGKDDA